MTGPETQTFQLIRDLVSLTSADGNLNSIIGRGVILHGGADDCTTQPTGMSGGPWAQGVIGIINPGTKSLGAVVNDAYQGLATQPKSAIGNFRAIPASGLTIQGFIQFGYNPTTIRVRVVLNVNGLAASTTHGIHVHQWGDDSDQTGDAAGGHYDPAGVDHGLPFNSTRHHGDMGSFSTNAQGNGMMDFEFTIIRLIPNGADLANIIGRSVIIHERVDDGSQPTGNAGARYAYAVIGISNRPMPPARLQLAQATVTGSFNYPAVRGTWTFSRVPGDSEVTVAITVTGLPAGTYATHIHKSVQSTETQQH